MPILRYIVWVGTSLLALLFVANWFLPDASQEAVNETIEKPVILIASVQRPPESVFIDTSQPTIVPPTMPAESAVPDVASPLHSYASIEPSRVLVGIDQRNPKKQNKTKDRGSQTPAGRVRCEQPTTIRSADEAVLSGRRFGNGKKAV
jgi:hypothetical protein